MDVGIGLPNAVRGVDRSGIVDWAKRAEEAGFASLGTIDRMAYPNYESLVSLAAAAAVTERVRLVTDILIGPLRTNTALLAKQAATIDNLSEGRLTLGLAVGGREDDYAATAPAIEVGGLPVGGRGPSVVTPEIKVSVPPVQISVPPVEVAVPLLNLPTVTLPPVELPTVTLPPTELPALTLPRTDLPTATRPGSRATVAGLEPQVDQRAGPPGTTSVRQTQEQTARTPQTTAVGTVSMISTAHTLKLSVGAWAMSSIGPPATVIVDELRQRVRAMDPASLGPTTAFVLAAAIGAAATGTASSGSAGAGGLAAISAAPRLTALSGSRRLSGRLRESAFRTPRRPGFSPD